MDYSLPRGLRDLAPEEFEKIELIRDNFIDVAKIFDFKLMEPSPIEMLQTLEAKSGSNVRNEIYHFKDKGDREIGLRFDLTVGLTRYVSSNRGLPLPIKIGSFSSMWRYDEPQFGRYRWFYQWNIEIFGAKNVEADAEIIDFTSTLFNRLGLNDKSIEIGDRTIINEFISNRLGINKKECLNILLRAVDKLERKTKNEIIKEYSSKEVPKNILLKMMNFGNLRGKPEIVLKNLNELGLQNTENLSCLVDALKERKVNEVILNMGIVRGLDYYTGIVFEVYENTRKLGALAGGGRYDNLPELFGRNDLCATGVAGGADRMILALSTAEKNNAKNSKVFVGYVGREMISYATQIAVTLRKNEIPTILEISGKSFRKQIEYASKTASLFIIVGPKDYAEGKVTIKDMRSGIENKISIENIADIIKNDI